MRRATKSSVFGMKLHEKYRFSRFVHCTKKSNFCVSLKMVGTCKHTLFGLCLFSMVNNVQELSATYFWNITWIFYIFYNISTSYYNIFISITIVRVTTTTGVTKIKNWHKVRDSLSEIRFKSFTKILILVGRVRQFGSCLKWVASCRPSVGGECKKVCLLSTFGWRRVTGPRTGPCYMYGADRSKFFIEHVRKVYHAANLDLGFFNWIWLIQTAF